jgi:uncharacterized membrane protein HdeD (DUF308 family)
MNASRLKYYKTLFLIAAIYDLVLGFVFMFFPRFAFGMLGIEAQLPIFGGYLSLIGAFLIVLGIAYFLISFSDLHKNRDLILVGALYKLAYCLVIFYYFFSGDLPHMVFAAVFGVADLVFFGLMAECIVYLSKGKREKAV